MLLGSLTTAVLTIYRERLVNKREIAVVERQHERQRKSSHDTFQRESILALQSAVTDLIKAAYEELDRVLTEFRQTGNGADADGRPRPLSDGQRRFWPLSPRGHEYLTRSYGPWPVS